MMKTAIMPVPPTTPASSHQAHGATAYSILACIALVHLLNDLIQVIVPSIYPMLKAEFGLTFTQIGLITLTFQCTASLLQPWIGSVTDRRPMPWLLPLGMVATLIGVLLMAIAASFAALLTAVALIGIGSSTFHPEASRVARNASGGRYGFAQAMFQVGGHAGSALGPLLAAAVIMGRGERQLAWFALVPALAFVLLLLVMRWQRTHLAGLPRQSAAVTALPLSRRRVLGALTVLALLVFSKYLYMASMTSYYTFYLIERFGVSPATAQMYLFLFLASVPVGTFIGGTIGDRIGRKRVIWMSILGAAPFTLLLPHVPLFWTAVLSVVIGLVMSSAFSAIVVLAQELVPGKVGMIAGLFFGLMFGVSGIGAAAMGKLADVAGIAYVYQLCAYLPLLGILAVLLPSLKPPRHGV